MNKKILAAGLALLVLCGCAKTNTSAPSGGESSSAVVAEGALVSEGKMELQYAKNFEVEYFKGGYKLLTIFGEGSFFVVPEGMTAPTELPADAIVLQQPLDNIMVSSTPTTSLFQSLGVLDKISMTTSERDSWYIEDVKAAFDKGSLEYVGNYKSPDYEIIMAKNPPLAIFSNMLSEAPETVAKFKELGIPLLADRAAYESHPLARVEWMKLYAALFNLEDKAQELVDQQTEFVASIDVENTPNKTGAIFYVTSKGQLYARNGGDYIAEMFNMAGGNYIFNDLNPDKTGNTNMEFEEFYAKAKDADTIIYIWSLGGKPETVEDLIERNPLLADFKAVKEGNVWCTTPDFFQISNTLGYMIKDINNMLNLEDPTVAQLTHLFRLK